MSPAAKNCSSFLRKSVVVVLVANPKGDNEMYNYMKALYLRFHKEARRSEELTKLYESVKQGLDREHQKLLLRLADAEIAYCEDIALESFVNGWCLAAGIASELKNHRYSFEQENEESARELFQKEQSL